LSFNKNITVLHNGLNPTSYYWLNHLNPNFLDLKKDFNLNLLNKKDTLIIVRYIPFKRIFNLFRLKKKDIKIILFIDDDLLSFNIFSKLPTKYKLKLFFRIYCYKHLLRFLVDQIWVTNLNLKKKLSIQLNNKIKIKVVDLNFRDNFTKKTLHRISFIGTSSHVLELKWIKGLFLKIQSQRDDCLIEIFINEKWRKYFKSIPRIKMIYPMDWESFLLDTRHRNVDIVLNPILKSEFNVFRSPTKFFDTTRLGAVGIYSKNSPYSSFVKDNYDGILLENDLDLWCKNIHYLLDNKYKRDYIYANANKRVR
tara:strand:- start:448 stop:1374 length:927 start_codon:yes stop_codon:yes gene_type:complete